MAITYGINMSQAAIAGDSASLIFADLWLTATNFTFKGTLRPDGYPASVGPGDGWATAQMVYNGQGRLPAGDLVFQARGTGKIGLLGGFAGNSDWMDMPCAGGTTSKTYTYKAPAQPGSIQVRITASDPSDPIEDIHLWMPGLQGQTFNPQHIRNLARFSMVRYMDPMPTPNNVWVDFADRLSPQGYSFPVKGRVDLEVLVAHHNAVNAARPPGAPPIAAWFCIPVLFSDDAIGQYASLLDATLDPGIPIRIESGNELWNPTGGCYGPLRALYDSGKDPLSPTVPGFFEYMYLRAARATNLFRSRVTSGRNCKAVLAGQLANQGATLDNGIAMAAAHGYTWDAYSGAPYFVTTADLDAAARLYSADPASAVTAVLAGMLPLDPGQQGQIAALKRKADRDRVPVIMYEGGQGLETGQDAHTALLLAVNRDPRMGDVYRAFMKALPDGVHLNWYSDCGTPSKWGAWGHAEHTADALLDPPPPKWAAIVEAASGARPAPPATQAPRRRPLPPTRRHARH